MPADDASTAPRADAGPRGPSGTVSIDFETRSGVSYCTTGGCGEAPPIQIFDSSGEKLMLSLACTTIDCTTCIPTPCVTTDCQPTGVAVTAAHLTWDGRIYVPGTCNGGTTCVTPAYAKPGRYAASLCLSPGTLSKPAGPPVCNQEGTPDCASVGFSYPGGAAVATISHS